jgi:hypothetical protein
MFRSPPEPPAVDGLRGLVGQIPERLKASKEDLDVPDATFATPDVTTFCRLDELGLVVVGQHLQPDRAVLACRVADDAVEEADRWCRRCGCEGRPRDTVTRRLAHEPVGWRPTTLLLSIRRYRCAGCGHVWREDTSRAAEPRAKLTRTALRWALVGLVCQHLTVARLAKPSRCRGAPPTPPCSPRGSASCSTTRLASTGSG